MPKLSIIPPEELWPRLLNMGGAGIADEIAAWWTAEVSFMNPRTAVMVVHGVKEEDDPARFAKLLVEMARNGSRYDLAAVYGVKDVLDPRETREYPEGDAGYPHAEALRRRGPASARQLAHELLS